MCVRAEIHEVRQTADGWVGVGPLLDETKAMLGKTRVTVKLDDEAAAECLDAIVKGAPRVEEFGFAHLIGAAL